MSAVVSGKSVVIYDDMIRTGGSLIAAARAYKSAGAVKLTAIATHGVFPGDALERLHRDGSVQRHRLHRHAPACAGARRIVPARRTHRRRSHARAGGVDMKQIAVAAAVINQIK